MGEHQQEGGLVRELLLVHLLHHFAITDDQEAGEVTFVGFDALSEDLQSVDLSRQFAADSRLAHQFLLGHHPRTRCGIVVLHSLEVTVLLEEVLALHQGDGVRVDLLDIGDVLVRKGNQVVLDAQFLFPGDAQPAVRQQCVVLQQATRDGVLDSDDSQQVLIGADRLEEFVEVVARNNIDLLTPKILPCGDIMETTRNALNNNFLSRTHIPIH